MDTIFTDTRELGADQFDATLGPLAALYSIPLPQPGAGAAAIQLTVKADWPGPVWPLLAPTQHPRFVKCAARVSVAIQTALRAWLPYLWLSEISRFEDFETAASLLIYSACRPFTPKNRQAFTFDVLDGDTRRAILYSAQRMLPPRLALVEAMLDRRGLKTAALYRPRHLERVMAVYERKPHALNAILVAERELVEEYVLRQERWANTKAREQSEQTLSRRYRKLFAQQDYSALRPVIEAEAAFALADWAQASFERTITWSACTFPANFPEAGALAGYEVDSHCVGGALDRRSFPPQV
jgi:hypothetical protein